MPGPTRAAALAAYITPLQLALSCVTNAVLSCRLPPPGGVQALTCSETPVSLRTPTGRLLLYVDQQYALQELPGRSRGSRWKVSTKAYRYRIDTPDAGELLMWHWHPGTPPPYPHVHVRRDGRLAGVHIPTGRVSMEAVLRCLITEFRVDPRRGDWEQVLATGEQAFVDHRSWG